MLVQASKQQEMEMRQDSHEDLSCMSCYGNHSSCGCDRCGTRGCPGKPCGTYRTNRPQRLSGSPWPYGPCRGRRGTGNTGIYGSHGSGRSNRSSRSHRSDGSSRDRSPAGVTGPTGATGSHRSSQEQWVRQQEPPVHGRSNGVRQGNEATWEQPRSHGVRPGVISPAGTAGATGPVGTLESGWCNRSHWPSRAISPTGATGQQERPEP